MPDVQLSAGTIEYLDSGPPPGRDDAPTVVLLHGLLMTGTVWDPVVPRLADACRVVRPAIPLGGHRIPMHADADLSLRGLARLVAEFLDALDLRDVTLVVNDWGGPLLLVEEGRTERIGRLVLTPCEAFDNFPPGIPGKLAAFAARRGTTGVRLAMQPLAIHPLRRFPLLFGWMSKRPVPREIADAWFAPIVAQREIRRDLVKYGGGRFDGAELIAMTERLREFDRPALVLWATEDKLMPREHGRRLAELLPQGRLVELDDCRTLVSIDRPEAVAEQLRAFVLGEAAAGAPAGAGA